MKCNFIENNVIAYIENGLSSEEFSLFEKHLSTCESCRTLVNNIRDTYYISHEKIEVSGDFFIKIQNKLKSVPVIGFSPVLKRFIVAASISILVASSLLTGLLFTTINNNITEEIAFDAFQKEPIEAFFLSGVQN